MVGGFLQAGDPRFRRRLKRRGELSQLTQFTDRRSQCGNPNSWLLSGCIGILQAKGQSVFRDFLEHALFSSFPHSSDCESPVNRL